MTVGMARKVSAKSMPLINGSQLHDLRVEAIYQ